MSDKLNILTRSSRILCCTNASLHACTCHFKNKDNFDISIERKFPVTLLKLELTNAANESLLTLKLSLNILVITVRGNSIKKPNMLINIENENFFYCVM